MTFIGKLVAAFADPRRPANGYAEGQAAFKLDFIEPMQAQNTAEFLLEPRDGATRVTWAMYGQNSFMAKVVHLFLDMDEMIGKQFEIGLANLRGMVEN